MKLLTTGFFLSLLTFSIFCKSPASEHIDDKFLVKPVLKDSIAFTNNSGLPVNFGYVNNVYDFIVFSIPPNGKYSIEAESELCLIETNTYQTLYFVQLGDTIVITQDNIGNKKFQLLSKDIPRRPMLDAFRFINEGAGKNYFQIITSTKPEGRDGRLNFVKVYDEFQRRFEKEKKLLSMYCQNNNCSDSLSKKLDEILSIQYKSKLLSYLGVNPKITVPDSFRDELYSNYIWLKGNNTISINKLPFNSLLYRYFKITRTEVDISHGDSLYNIAKNEFLGHPALEEMLFLIVKTELLKTPNSNASCIRKFLSDTKSPMLINYITQIINSQSVNSGRGGEDTLLMGNSQPVSLKDIMNSYKGNVVYLDIWASWCVPCRAEMKSELKLVETFANKPIKFVLISRDDNFNNWKLAAEKDNLTQHKDNFLFPNFDSSSFAAKYKILTIPRYLLFDKAGKLISANAPRPSDPKLLSLLKKELSK